MSALVLRKAVFLDRDGVLNASVVRNGRPYPPANAAEMTLLPGVPEAIASLKRLGYLCIVVTNQPDIARGTTTRVEVDAINARLQTLAPVDEIRVCPHDSVDACDCRKPKPGLLTAAQREHGIDMARSFMVGDRWRDIDAGIAAGVRTLFVDYGYEEQTAVGYDWKVASLQEAAKIIETLENMEPK